MLAELERVLDRKALIRVSIPFFVLKGAAAVSEVRASYAEPR